MTVVVPAFLKILNILELRMSNLQYQYPKSGHSIQ